MHIWLINPFDELPGEGPEQRYACLARLLTERGHSVLWISGDWHHRRKEKRSGVLPRPGVSLLLIPVLPYRANLSLRRILSHVCWGRRLDRELKQRVESGALSKPDIILASTPPLEGAAAALRLARRFRAKGIVDVMDDWPETWLQPLPESGFRRALAESLLWPWRRLARRLMREADAVSAQSERFAGRAKELGHAGTLHVCYLGERELVLPPPKAAAAFHVLYLGAMGRIYDMETILQAALLARNEGRDWRWTLAGSDPGGRWQQRAKDLGLEQTVAFPGYVQGEELRALLSAAAVGVVPIDPRSGVAVPYKAGTYLAAGLAVVNSLPGELADLMEESEAGRAYVYGSATSLLEALRPYAENPERLPAARAAAGRLFQTRFNRDLQYRRWVEWMESEIAGKDSFRAKISL